MTLRLTVVPTRNNSGEQLGKLIQVWAADSLGGKVHVELAHTEKDIRDTLMSDIIILDLSVAPESEHNYDVLAHFPRYRDFMFLVSRTPIPFNVRWGVHRGIPLFPKQQTNQEIVAWLTKELLPNTIEQYARGWWDKMGSTARSTIQWQMWERREAAIRRIERNNHRLSRTFISFRGIDLDEARKLAQSIRNSEESLSKRVPRDVVMYDGEILALQNELLPQMLRWQVQAIISDDILSSSDFVVAQSDAYLRSWWTRGELFICNYFPYKPHMHVYDVNSRQFVDEVEGYQFALSEEDRGKLSKMFTNSHPEMMAPESAEIYRFMKENPRWWTRRGPVSGWVDLPQFNEQFEQVPLLQCDSCTKRQWETKVPRDFGTFIRCEYPVMHPIDPELLERAAQNHELFSCPEPTCKQQFFISTPPPHYVWYPPHPTQPIIKEIQRPRLMMLQTYLARAAEA